MSTIRIGGSCGVAFVLALLVLYVGCKLVPKVVILGGIGLTGEVIEVGGLIEKLWAAWAYGADLTLVPKGNEKEVKEALQKRYITAALYQRVRFVERVTEVFTYSVQGATRAKALVFPKDAREAWSHLSLGRLDRVHLQCERGEPPTPLYEALYPNGLRPEPCSLRLEWGEELGCPSRQ